MWLLDSSYIVSSINTALGKIRTLICSIKFFFEVVLCLYKFNIQTYMEYYCHVWTGAPICKCIHVR